MWAFNGLEYDSYVNEMIPHFIAYHVSSAEERYGGVCNK